MSGEADWDSYAVPNLVDILDLDLRDSWEQVSAWIATGDVMSSTKRSLADARADLAAAWNPESSSAAQLYFQVIDLVMGFIDATENAVRINADALRNALTSMTSTKLAIDQLNSAWHAHLEQVREAPSLSPSGAPIDWPTRLNIEARQHMVAMDQVAFEVQERLVVPANLPQTISQIAESFTETLSRISTNGPTSGGTLILTGGASSSRGSANVGSARPTVVVPLPASDSRSTTARQPSNQPQLRPESGLSYQVQSQVGGTRSDFTSRPSVLDPDSTSGTMIGRQSGRGESGDGIAPVNTSKVRDAEISDSGTGLAGTAIPSPVGGSSSSRSSSRRRHATSAPMWPMLMGVPSVLTADCEQDIHDPGSGVIGLDW